MRDTSAYQIDGRRIPSVTEILDIAGVISFPGVPPEILALAAARGTRVHEWTEWHDQGNAPEIEPDIEGYCIAYKQFLADTHFKVVSAEQTIVNKDYRYAGTYDRLGILGDDGLETLVDIKCVDTVSAATRLQTAGYALGIKPEMGFPFFDTVKRAALQLKPDGKYRIHRYDGIKDFHDWLACVRIAHWKLQHGIAQLRSDTE